MNPASGDPAGIEEIFDAFGKAWLKYWDSYVALQDKLYECLRAAREVQWLAATDTTKLSEINAIQRELFASMPRRLDYTPLGQISRDLDSAPTRVAELEDALESEVEACRRLEEAIEILKTQVQALKSLNPARR